MPAPTASPRLGGELPPALLRRVLAYVEERLGDPIDLDALAAVVGHSRYDFARKFRRSTGEPPIRYLRRRRLERAAALLSERRGRGAPTVAEVAARVGYGSPAAFAQAFRRRFGVSPTDHRRGGRARAEPA